MSTHPDDEATTFWDALRRWFVVPALELLVYAVIIYIAATR